MQNLKSLDNLIQKPVLGANDMAREMTGHPCVELYSYEDQVRDMLHKVFEEDRKHLEVQLLYPAQQD